MLEQKSISKEGSINELSYNDLVDEFITFYLAGMDTTGHLIAMIIYYLSVYPDVLVKHLKNILVNLKNYFDQIRLNGVLILNFYMKFLLIFESF